MKNSTFLFLPLLAFLTAYTTPIQALYPTQSSLLYEFHLEQGLQEFQEKNFSLAQAYLTSALTYMPHNSKALSTLGDMYQHYYTTTREVQNLFDAYKAYKRAFDATQKITPEYYDITLKLSSVLVQLSEIPQGTELLQTNKQNLLFTIRSYLQLIADTPHIQTYYLLSCVYTQLGDTEQAQHWFSLAQDLNHTVIIQKPEAPVQQELSQEQNTAVKKRKYSGQETIAKKQHIIPSFASKNSK